MLQYRPGDSTRETRLLPNCSPLNPGSTSRGQAVADVQNAKLLGEVETTEQCRCTPRVAVISHLSFLSGHHKKSRLMLLLRRGGGALKLIRGKNKQKTALRKVDQRESGRAEWSGRN
ncbi:hypothetical protein J6590_052354 [Homalodisca vitripennis]|nr:hypothetical protein J6590_052354 [Homalodisca vitripennis]